MRRFTVHQAPLRATQRTASQSSEAVRHKLVAPSLAHDGQACSSKKPLVMGVGSGNAVAPADARSFLGEKHTALQRIAISVANALHPLCMVLLHDNDAVALSGIAATP